MDDEPKVPIEDASEITVTISEGRDKPYPARYAMDSEVPADEDAENNTSVGGTETPDPAQSTHTVATVAESSRNNPLSLIAVAEDLRSANEREHRRGVGDTPVEHTENVPTPGVLKKSHTEVAKSSWGLDLGFKKGIEKAKTFFDLR
jgi:hypothetical protein